MGVTMARRVRVRRLNRVDLPTLGRPTSTTEERGDGMREGYWRRIDRLSYYSYDSYGHTAAGTERMIKVDIVNEVSRVADITKVKAEVAVDAVFDAMRVSMQRGDRIEDRKSTRLNSSHSQISYAVFCLKK